MTLMVINDSYNYALLSVTNHFFRTWEMVPSS